MQREEGKKSCHTHQDKNKQVKKKAMPRKHPSTANPGSTFKISIFHHLKSMVSARVSSSTLVVNRARIARQSSTTWLLSLVRLRPPQSESLSWRKKKKTWRVFKRMERRDSGDITKTTRAAHFSGNKQLSSSTWTRLMWWQLPCAFDYWRENRAGERMEGEKACPRARAHRHTHTHTQTQGSIIMLIRPWTVKFYEIRLHLFWTFHGAKMQREDISTKQILV